LHSLGIAAWVKLTNSGYLVAVDFSLFIPKMIRWRLSAIKATNLTFGPSIEQSSALPLRRLSVCLIANTWLPTSFTYYTQWFSQSLNKV